MWYHVILGRTVTYDLRDISAITSNYSKYMIMKQIHSMPPAIQFISDYLVLKTILSLQLETPQSNAVSRMAKKLSNIAILL